ncbi:hydroxymethylpyrimidine/phosphomethylpyrimidine kinase [Litorimonas taeanensis]|uniref:hydroxymethylpyrimidine kinase n=1 Tax=Litorimonas taeanensis TaxID=568099 RepID=A0A420WLJ2_9PROT|nr:bifunctional hydroxymethylpyrimidine kinase/phosphomethylpyrimidine kinase [Litorimonas taeanensis]RKQ71782.1 hydroxymethylpyrimidine/phosphomethylpyrimidine kinase [Litorimonas taeanensis]
MSDQNDQGRVLIIAGSDSSGGAGIQADIKACAAFGAYSQTAITAITVQNTLGVTQVEYLKPELVRAQIKACLSDIGADVVKIGMLGTKAIIDVVAEEIEPLDAFIILDPVSVATSGDKLLQDDAMEAMRDTLLPLADLVTPNVPEAEWLTGISITDIDDLTKAGDALLSRNVYAALMKGGHLKGKSVVDVLVSEEGTNIMSGPRIHSRHTHGTGCTLASAIAAAISLGATLEEAVMSAREFVFEAIRTAPKLGGGNGPLNHGLAMGEAEAEETPDPSNPFAALKGLKN